MGGIINNKNILEWTVFLFVFLIVWTHVNVVVSDSMVPVMTRGDFVVVENSLFEFDPESVSVGDIIVYSAHWTNAGENKIINQDLSINGRNLNYYELNSRESMIYNLPIISSYSPTTPVIHRVIDTWTDSEGNKYYITKGDNNPTYDPELIRAEQVKQRVVELNDEPFIIPYLGHISIILKENLIIFVILLVIWMYYDYRKEKVAKNN
ncbi:S26 family signal peptidase [Methanococcus maripaludis]|uniref:S26 family signal peptidase n=1 Tax=Methanococcus maripaludis TaxID=39152 RepID=UPI0015EC2B96|nr:S26 family signal peptidase [Methanococcus maripaludis]